MATLTTPGSSLLIELVARNAAPIPIVHPPYNVQSNVWAGDIPAVLKQAAENFNWG